MPDDSRFPTILLFLKAPVPGTVKTRLAHSLGATEATRIYRQLVERQLSAIPTGWPVEIHYAPSEAEGLLRDWLGDDYHYFPQTEGDLGDRMSCATKESLLRGARRIICIGGDCPTLEGDDFRFTEEQLEQGYDLVFGPTYDGGYYLVGMSTLCEEIFEGIPWSSPKTLTSSLLTAKRFKRSLTLLEIKNDVDDLHDWEKVKDLFQATI